MAIGIVDQHLYTLIVTARGTTAVRHYGPVDSWVEAKKAADKFPRTMTVKIVPLHGLG